MGPDAGADVGVLARRHRGGRGGPSLPRPPRSFASSGRTPTPGFLGGCEVDPTSSGLLSVRKTTNDAGVQRRVGVINSSLFRVQVVLAFLGLAGWAATAVALEASVSGTVLDGSGAGLPGAGVSALNVASGKVTTAIADQEGRYEIQGLSPGLYRLTARLQGFCESGHSVALSTDDAVRRDFALELGSLSEEITVTAARGERATSEIPQ